MISVIITCYNLAPYVAQAIESALAQVDAGAMEILVVDDCSGDASAEIIRRYPQVRYLCTGHNGGVLLATVTGIEHSRGDYLLFLDGDDVWEPDKAARTRAAFEADAACALVTHDLSFIDAHGRRLDRISRPGRVCNGLDTRAAGDRVGRGILQHTDYVWLGSAYAVHRTRADVGGFCRFARALGEAANTYQDWPLAYWAMAQPGVTAAYVPQALFRYRLHGANHSGDAASRGRALRNVRRTLNTMLAIQAIARRFDVDPAAQQATRRKLAFVQYLDDLYNGHRGSALRGFVTSLPYLSTLGLTGMAKELVRFVALSTVGVDGLVQVLKRIRRGG